MKIARNSPKRLNFQAKVSQLESAPWNLPTSSTNALPASPKTEAETSVRLSNVAGIPLTELLDQAAIDRLVDRARNGGAEIVKYLKTGSAYYAPSAATVEMVESILKDKKKVLPCAAYLEGEYGIQGLFVGVPVKLGSRGIERIYEIKLNADEQAMLKKSADAVKELVDVIKSKM